MNRDEYVVELEQSVKEKFEEAKLRIKQKRNSAAREGSQMRALDAYRFEAVNIDKLIVYLGPAIQETIRVSSSKAIRGCLPINVGSVENER